MKLADQLLVARQLGGSLRSQWWPADRIRSYQEAALVRMMRYAVTHVPFYRRLGLAADTIQRPADLERFPLIRKRDLQQEPQAFLADGFEPTACHASRTSGSSGEPTTTYFDRDSWLLTRYALKMRRVAATAGMPWLRRVLIVSEQPVEQLGAVAQAAPNGLGALFQVRHVSIHTPPEQHLEELERFRPHVIYAFPSYLLDLVEVAERRGQPLPQTKVLCTSSEVLAPSARRRIEAAFRGRLFDVYGSTEFKEVAWQCGVGGYHLNFESVYVEPQHPGPSAPLVLTTLCNRAMPLLRFDVGDTATFAADPCPCGRASPCLEQIAGREGDMIQLPSGRRLSPYLLTTAIEAHDSVRTYRIVQTEADAFRIDLALAGRQSSQDWHGRLCTDLARIIAEPARISVRIVDAIERAPGGKRAVFVRAKSATVE
jgi:phenylacetate-CoA ligase